MVGNFPGLETALQNKIKERKQKHIKLTTILSTDEIGLSAEVTKVFADLQKKFDNQTERIKITFGIN